ncbi:hypothetical protein ['Paenibacillus yunnanensis' Narsing Rao et al. 2020]|uniref:hypothetical protein n=1 Tax=Paenibacillus tengchongensis TaxID=2608684 RepID=UPI0016529D8C|nr:hypothetical protein [Paenibacillus tengchongensis]
MKDDIQFIKDKVEPFFEVTTTSINDQRYWSIFVDYSNLNQRTGWESITPSFKGDLEPKREYLFNPGEKSICILQPQDRRLRLQIAVRLCRDILKHLLLDERISFFHSGMVVYKDKGICFMGPKKAGKTSSILSLLSKGEGKFVSNDDLSITINEKGEFLGYGWPRALSIRKDAIQSMENVLKDFDFSHSLEHPDNFIEELSNHIFLYPADMCRLFGCEIVPEYKVDKIIFPEFWSENDFQVKKLDKNEKLLYLENNLDVDINKYFLDFKDFFPEANGLEVLFPDFLNIEMYAIKQNIEHMHLTSAWISSVIDE